MDPRLVEILQRARSGERQPALLDLRDYVKTYPEDVNAWLVLGDLAPDPKIRLSALRRALQLDPENAAVRQALDALSAAAPPEVVSLALMETVPAEAVAAERGASEPATAETPAVQIASVDVPAVDVTAVDVATVDVARIASTEIAPPIAPELPAVLQDQVPDAAPVGVPPAIESVGNGEPHDFQSVREARAQLWPFVPRNEKKRALGELLDEGRVTRQDLLWAAEKAQEIEVREAAQAVLDHAHRLPDVGMSLEDARLVAWPFRRLNRPLGELVDNGVIKANELRRATWFAQDARVREAARLLIPEAGKRQKKRKKSKKPAGVVPETAMPSKFEKRRTVAPRSRARPMPIIEGANYLISEIERRARLKVLLEWGLASLLLIGTVVALVYLILGSVSGQSPPLWAWLLIALFLLPLFWISERLAELKVEEQNFRKGQQGEVQVARKLREGLGGDWMLFRNVKLPGCGTDIDMVLLGPPGMFSLEVKAYSGAYLYRKERFYRRSVMGWRSMHHNPGRQARAGAGLLHQYISLTLNRDIWVEPRLAWVGPGSLDLDAPQVFVWYMDRLDRETERLRSLPATLSEQDRATLSGLLRGLCSTLRHSDTGF
ncbi:MAG: NERD domain-containing protein [Anaerolineae bacterium]|nr:NERD domain-containing protein [Anaerolineae bacterium]